MSDSERAPAPFDIAVMGEDVDTRMALIEAWQSKDPDMVFSYQDARVEGDELRLKGMSKVTKAEANKAGLSQTWRGDLVCKQPRKEVYNKIRGGMHKRAHKQAEEMRNKKTSRPEDICKKASPRKANSLPQDGGNDE